MISIHSPSEGRDRFSIGSNPDIVLFQSTLPAKGETQLRVLLDVNLFISIHSPSEGRDEYDIGDIVGARISIHSPSEGRDGFSFFLVVSFTDFNPLSQRRERLLSVKQSISLNHFNPLSQRRERPYQGILHHMPTDNFNPLSQRRERRKAHLDTYGPLLFQSTLPAKGETQSHGWHERFTEFQSTLPAKGETHNRQCIFIGTTFQSTLPAKGETRAWIATSFALIDFNPLSQRRERHT